MLFDNSRRKALSFIVGGVVLGRSNAQARCPADPLSVCDVTQLSPVKVAGVAEIRGADDVRRALRKWNGNVSVGGGRFSMGGQTAIRDGLQLNMRPMNGLVAFDPVGRVARVQAGMRWRDLQTAIDPAGLSVQTMQSYSSFTIGGSVSVNCHGRYVGHGPVSGSVRALQMVLADGEIVETSRQTNAELFHAALGGYGGLGVVTEVELNLNENFRIRRSTGRVALEDYPAWFVEKVQSDPKALLHNADLMPGKFDAPHCITWARTDDALSVQDRLTMPGKSYAKEALFLWAMTELPGGAGLREKITVPLAGCRSIRTRKPRYFNLCSAGVLCT
jgi:FAD/FMN-containing dehydrogenase